MVVTDATFRVRDRVKGGARDEIVLREPGGELPERNLGMLVPHTPRFQAGEDALLFLAHDTSGSPRLVGGAAGRVRLRQHQGETHTGDLPWSMLRARLAERAARGGKH
jgi:hypothetical protein